MLNVKLAGDHLYGRFFAVPQDVAGGLFGGVFWCCPYSQRCLGWDLRLDLVIFWGFSYLLLLSIFCKDEALAKKTGKYEERVSKWNSGKINNDNNKHVIL